jgi:pimeloyl-ACP methyl ester carboxylesterase
MVGAGMRDVDMTVIADDRLRLAGTLRELLAHDPSADLANIRAPVLAITGGKDVQVDPAGLDEIRRLAPGEVEIHRIADLTHLRRRDPGHPSARSDPRQLRRPVDTDLLARVSDWLARRLRETSTENQATERT